MSVVVMGCGAYSLLGRYVRSVVAGAERMMCRVVIVSGSSRSRSYRVLGGSFPAMGLVEDGVGLNFKGTGGLNVGRTSKGCLFFLGSSAVLYGGTVGGFFRFSVSCASGLKTAKAVLGSGGKGGVRSCNGFVAVGSRLGGILAGCSGVFNIGGGASCLCPPTVGRSGRISCVAKTSLFVPCGMCRRLRNFSPVFFVCYRRMS